MRLVCYLGTRGCPGALEEALREHFGPLTIAVPVEPRLLGTGSPSGMAEGLASVAEILADRALERGLRIAQRNERELSDVFDEEADPSERIETRVLEPPIEDAVAESAGQTGARQCFLARDALDVLDAAGVRLASGLEDQGVSVVTR